MLHVLSMAAGRVVTYEALLNQVWGGGRRNGGVKVVCAFVKQLRGKLGDGAPDLSWIFNVRGVSYRMRQRDARIMTGSNREDAA